MPSNIIMPQLGESVVDGTVGEWLKKIGDSVDEFEPIVRVATDKVDTEIPAPAKGILLEIKVKEGETVLAGVVLGVIGTAQEAQASVSVPEPKLAVAPSPAPVATLNGKHHGAPIMAEATNETAYSGNVTPVVARMAAEHQLDLSQVRGTGRDGRITKKDVEAYLAQRANTSQSTPAGKATPALEDLPPWERPGSGDLFKPTVEYSAPSASARPVAESEVKAIPHPQTVAPSIPPRTEAERTEATGMKETHFSIPGELLAMSGMRRSIAEHMVRSKLQTAPHVTTVFEADLSAIVAHRAAHKDAYAKQGVNLTFTAYFMLAIVDALKAYPILNARWVDGEGVYMHHVINLGMATALDDGLIVPVIKNAQDYNLLGMARQVNDLSERARKKQLRPDEVRDGTFTLTNHGVTGSLFATPIINQPQAAILGVGAIEKRVKVINDMMAIRPCSYLSLTFDHRQIDGATGDKFTAHIKRVLEHWQ